MSGIRVGVLPLAGVVLALAVLGPASARVGTPSKYGGTLTVGLSAEPDGLDPTLSHQFSAVEVYRTFCEKLYDLNGNGQPVPQLAAALPVISKDKLTYTIQLRPGIVFNDGTPFNAQAVVTTLQRNLTLDGSTRASDLDSIDSVTASGASTVVLHLTLPEAPLLDDLTTAATAIMSPAQLTKLGTNFGTNPICVGPFMYDNRVAGDSITVIKSPYYYDKYAVHLDKIVFRVAKDPAAAVAALEAGDLQALDSVSTTQLQSVAQTPSLRILRENTFGYQSIVFNIGNKNGVGNLPYVNMDTPFASSAKLRQAFEEAIDRTTLGRVVFGGNVQPGCTPVSPASPWYASIQCTPYDPANAKRLIAQSGFLHPTVHLLTPNAGDNPRLAQFIQAEEAAVGINVVIDSTDNVAAQAQEQSGNYDAHLGGWRGRSDPDPNIFQFLTTTGPRNYSGYSNPRLDLILENGRKAVTETARRTLYRAAQQIILTDRPIIYLFDPIAFAGVSTAVTGVQLAPELRVAFAQYK
jgi:peptide/nickel transport system substrate-binding protein